MLKILLIVSIIANIYFAITLKFHAPFGIAGGRVLYLDGSNKVYLSSRKDWFGIHKFYELRVLHNDRVIDIIRFKPKGMLPWFQVREIKDVLCYDAEQGVVICKIAGYEIRRTIEKGLRAVGDQRDSERDFSAD